MKTDIFVKPNPEHENSYLVKITNKAALEIFNKVFGWYKLNKYQEIDAKCFNFIQYGVWTERFNTKISYAKMEHFEHGL